MTCYFSSVGDARVLPFSLVPCHDTYPERSECRSGYQMHHKYGIIVVAFNRIMQQNGKRSAVQAQQMLCTSDFLCKLYKHSQKNQQ